MSTGHICRRKSKEEKDKIKQRYREHMRDRAEKILNRFSAERDELMREIVLCPKDTLQYKILNWKLDNVNFRIEWIEGFRDKHREKK